MFLQSASPPKFEGMKLPAFLGKLHEDGLSSPYLEGSVERVMSPAESHWVPNLPGS
jgi:hypothetical protein